MSESYKKLIHESIKTIINQFHRKPDNFFNEHEFHSYCYHVFYRKREFSKQYKTANREKTNILHPEYPTLQRFNRKRIKVDPKGKRARYDMAILNPAFIENNTFKKVQCRDLSLFRKQGDSKSKNLLAALEFKFIIQHGPQYKREIKYDHLKLTSADEVEQKFMLVFTNTLKREIDYFKHLGKDEQIKIIYVAVFKKNGKKELRINQYPKLWLKI